VPTTANPLVFVILAVAATFASSARADDVFPITGTYIENQACRGDSSDPTGKRIKITDTEIDSSFGLCTLQDKRRNGNKITAQVTCKDPDGGTVGSEISFTIRDDKTLDFSDQFETYKTTLYKCPN
jgi:hypothetical protein